MNQYYYQQMTKPEQIVYRQMYDGLTALAPSFQVAALSMKELGDIFFRLRLDHPWIFYATNFSCRMAQGVDSMMMKPEYMFEKKKIKEHQNTLQARMARLIRPAQKMNELDKEHYIHSFICEHVRYDKLKKSYSHEIIGPLQQGIGVCEGIAKTVKLFCDMLGMECMIAICDADPEHGSKYRHAWNILRINGQYYHLDATFDNSLGRCGAARYDYFNLEDKQIFRDHRPLIYPAPSCSRGDFFYYKEHKLSFTKSEDVIKRIQQVIRKKQNHFIFHWRGGYLTREVLAQLMELTAEAAAQKEKGIKFSVNVPQAVIMVAFTDLQMPPQLIEEEAEEV